MVYNSCMSYTKNKRDKSEHEIVSFWRSVGATWLEMPGEVGFDGLLVYRTLVHIVEIKSPGSWKLTPHEVEVRERCEFEGVRYNIVETVEEAGQLIGLDML